MPIFFAGLVFVRSFADLRFSGAALGWNLFGAVFGGMLETTSQATGMRALTLMAVGLYVGSWIARQKAGIVPARMSYPRPRRTRGFGGYAIAESGCPGLGGRGWKETLTGILWVGPCPFLCPHPIKEHINWWQNKSDFACP